MILEGLSSYYTSVISVIESKFDIMNMDKVEILLVDHDLTLTNFNKTLVLDIVSLNLTQTMPLTQAHVESQTVTYESHSSQVTPRNPEYDYQSFRGAKPGCGGRNGRGR